MRRILVVAFAVLLLQAAPAMADECINLALVANGGTVSASGQSGTAFGPAALNDGRRQTALQGPWQPGSPHVWGDWAQIEWRSPTAMNRIIVRAPVGLSHVGDYQRVMNRLRVQHWDDAGSNWLDVHGKSFQPNPILNWVPPHAVVDGTEHRQFDFHTITTSKIRVLIEEGNPYFGTAWLEEIEAYERASRCVAPGDLPNLALAATATASSVHSSGSYPVAGVNNGESESGSTMGYWNDGTNGTWPDWVQVAWPEPVSIDRIVARIPIARADFPVGEITLRRTRIQYWDAATSDWIDVVDRDGESNPILDWTGPIDVADGSESKVFDFDYVTTTKVRALIEDGSTDGWSWLDEIEAYCVICTTRDQNLAPVTRGGLATASSIWNSTWSASRLNNEIRERSNNAYWSDGTRYVFPDWAQIEWTSPRPLNRIVLRGPVWVTNDADGIRTLGRTRVQTYDAGTSSWVDVVSNAGQSNPILSWRMPFGTADGSETKQFDFDTVTTRRIRALIEQGSTDGFSWLEEIEAYWVS